MSMDTIRTAYAENLPELITNRRVGVADIIAAVRQALLGDIFVLIYRSYQFLVLIPSLIKSLIICRFSLLLRVANFILIN